MKTIKEKGKTAKCPDCGNKYLVKTGYCLTCKKKVKKKESTDTVIEVKSEVAIGDVILEKGDKIKVLNETKVTPERQKVAIQFIKKSKNKVTYMDDEVIEFEDGFKSTWERFSNAEFRMNNKWVKPYIRAATNTYISKYGEMPPYTG